MTANAKRMTITTNTTLFGDENKPYPSSTGWATSLETNIEFIEQYVLGTFPGFCMLPYIFERQL